jgi:hypothetical protein
MIDLPVGDSRHGTPFQAAVPAPAPARGRRWRHRPGKRNDGPGAEPVVEVKGQVVIDADRHERPGRPARGEADQVSEELGATTLVTHGHDRVVEDDGHR